MTNDADELADRVLDLADLIRRAPRHRLLHLTALVGRLERIAEPDIPLARRKDTPT
jgi:hypothetical protein